MILGDLISFELAPSFPLVPLLPYSYFVKYSSFPLIPPIPPCPGFPSFPDFAICLYEFSNLLSNLFFQDPLRIMIAPGYPPFPPQPPFPPSPPSSGLLYIMLKETPLSCYDMILLDPINLSSSCEKIFVQRGAKLLK